MTFWLTALFAAAIVAFVIVLTLLRGRLGGAPAAAYDLQVYRDQLKEVERDLARGTLTPEDAERTRIEVSRRLLEADRALRQAGGTARAPRGLTWAAGLVSGLVVLGGAWGLYSQLGAPGYPDQPLAKRKAAAQQARQTRPSQAEAEAQLPSNVQMPQVDQRHRDLVKQLREVLQTRPDDPRGLALLARNEAVLGNYRAAHAAQSKLIALKGADATAADFADLGEMLVLAAGGYVSPEAEAAFDRALRKDPQNPIARYYKGLLNAQVGRPDIAFRLWRDLLEDSPPDAPWTGAIRAGLPELAMRAGVDYRLPAAPDAPMPGPSEADMQAAADMTPEQRQQMIRGMVERLNDRLAREGGTAAEWARLIGALGTLGESDRARAIWTEAQQVFADRPEALGQLRQAARQAGVAE